jgi:uncharacterized protein YndB with AHSA1/START domain
VTDHVATAEIEMDASPAKVWAALTDPQQIKEYMFGSQVVTDWEQGSQIVWKGEYEGTRYEDKGEIVEIEPERRLKVTHFSPLSGERINPRTTTQFYTSSRIAVERRASRSARTTTRARRQRSIRGRTGRRCSPD